MVLFGLIAFFTPTRIRNVPKSEHISRFSSKIVEIPTSIKFKEYSSVKTTHKEQDNFVIGWVGSKSTSKNLLSLIDVFLDFKKCYPNVLFRFIGFDITLQPMFNKLDVEFISWSSENELKTISTFTVGIMPLENNYFNNGKCGFKLIQYMGVGIPTISTPLVANIKINRSGKNLFANSKQEWFAAFEYVYFNRDYFKSVGIENQSSVEKYYSVEANQHQYINLMKSLIAKK